MSSPESSQSNDTGYGCLGHGLIWLLVSILIIGVTFVVVLGCYGLSRLVR
jgi:hypothetical protein